MSEPTDPTVPFPASPERRPEDLLPAARRALAEAEARRAAATAARLPEEVNGRGGAEPTRFGDWEKNGIVSDF
ncbi:DUF1674 domain-containing protein [Aureimonas sp. ME7]|uniref:DUF1674 domain-containing protein n=1 Tax=Aureimonas sp. ME7 TaxID=2744252 RepID=UPI0015F66B06|nr:DUF1674 domain-containing protein [Aureimonas sp. ME7]